MQWPKLSLEEFVASEAREQALMEAAMIIYNLAASETGKCEECLLMAADAIRGLMKAQE